MSQHRVLVIGVGSIGERHVRCFLATGRADVAIVETNESLEGDISRRYGVASFRDIETALFQQPTGAVIATPAHWHVPQATTLLESGLHVLIEKPLSISCEGTSTLCDLARERNLTAGMAYVYRAFPVLVAMRQA